MTEGSILIVDDNKSILSALEILLTGEFRNVTALQNPNQLITELGKNDS